MKTLLSVAALSAWNRRGTLVLVVLSIALATALLLTLERLRTDIRASFLQAVSGTDLVVGARTGPVQLMLYAVFRVGGATNSIGMDSVRAISEHRAVAWTVPLALGDSHRGFPVLGSTPAYFQHFRYGDQQALALAAGQPFAGTLDGLYEAVLGAEVAQRLGYRLGQRITLSHGLQAVGGALAAGHDDKPFTVVGVLARTGTPVDLGTINYATSPDWLKIDPLDFASMLPPGINLNVSDSDATAGGGMVALNDVRGRVERLGLKTYTQVIDSPAGPRTRVRVGPFDSRAEADAAGAKLRTAGLPAAILTL